MNKGRMGYNLIISSFPNAVLFSLGGCSRLSLPLTGHYPSRIHLSSLYFHLINFTHIYLLVVLISPVVLTEFLTATTQLRWSQASSQEIAIRSRFWQRRLRTGGIRGIGLRGSPCSAQLTWSARRWRRLR